MREHYDFSKMKGRKNPYTKYLKQPVTMRLDCDTVAYFKSMAEENRGVAWVPRMRLRTTDAKKPLVPAGGEDWWIPIEIRIFKARGPLPKCAEAFWSSIADLAITDLAITDRA